MFSRNRIRTVRWPCREQLLRDSIFQFLWETTRYRLELPIVGRASVPLRSCFNLFSVALTRRDSAYFSLAPLCDLFVGICDMTRRRRDVPSSLTVPSRARDRSGKDCQIMDRTRLLLVDDHILFREGLSRLLASEPDFEIAGSCGTAAEALEVLKQTTVDLVLLDFDLGEEHASQFISFARRHGFEGKILMGTAGISANDSSIAIQLGASGIFLKQNSPATLARAVRMVVGGEAWVC